LSHLYIGSKNIYPLTFTRASSHASKESCDFIHRYHSNSYYQPW